MSQAKANKLKLLVVDDEPDNLDLLYRSFRRDYKVFKANGPLKALETLESEGEMAVIISDQRMPFMNGTEFLGKTVEKFPDTIRILLTGYTDVEDLVDAINSGKVFKYITKPWTPDHLQTVVQQASETYRLLKKRTNELRRALRQEELFNLITRAIRESLNYESMLQTIVQTIGTTFATTGAILKPIENNQLMSDCFFYQTENQEQTKNLFPDSQALMQTVLETGETQIFQNDSQTESWAQLAVPLACQKQPLAVLCLYQNGGYHPWTESDVQLLESVAEQAALAISQAKLYQQIQQQADKMRAELEVARQIQHNLLRQSWPKVEGVRVQTSCYPAREVGGDFFEVHIHPQGDVWLAVGDVSGKGVPAALFMASALSILRRELAQETPPAPHLVMQNLNLAMLEDLFSTNCFITMVIARYTPATQKLVYANAGHIYPMIWSHKILVEQRTSPEQEIKIKPNYLKIRGVPVGILPVWQANAGEMTLNPGDILLVTSDGITEATVNSQVPQQFHNHLKPNSMLKPEGLWQLILKESYPFELDNLLSSFSQYTNKIQEDDQTILSLEVL